MKKNMEKIIIKREDLKVRIKYHRPTRSEKSDKAYDRKKYSIKSDS